MQLAELDTLGETEVELVNELVEVREGETEEETVEEEVTEGDADKLPLREALMVGVAVVPGAMQQAGSSFEQFTSIRPTDNVDCTQLVVPSAFLG